MNIFGYRPVQQSKWMFWSCNEKKETNCTILMASICMLSIAFIRVGNINNFIYIFSSLSISVKIEQNENYSMQTKKNAITLAIRSLLMRSIEMYKNNVYMNFCFQFFSPFEISHMCVCVHMRHGSFFALFFFHRFFFIFCSFVFMFCQNMSKMMIYRLIIVYVELSYGDFSMWVWNE